MSAAFWASVVTGVLALLTWWIKNQGRRDDKGAQKRVDEFRKAVGNGKDSKTVIMLDDVVRRRMRDKDKGAT